MYSYYIWRAWHNGSHTMTAKPIRALELHYPMIQFLIIAYINLLVKKGARKVTDSLSGVWLKGEEERQF